MDVNCDLGEGVGGQRHDARIMASITSASIACGGHAGDPATMTATVQAAMGEGVVVGAHPSYPDRAGFGRVPMAMPGHALAATVEHQLRALVAIGSEVGQPVRFVKAHGALYNEAARDESVAASVLDGIAAVDAALPVLTLPASALGRLAAARGVPVFVEAFPDRGYRLDGSLQPRTEAGSVIHDPELVAARALRLVTEGVIDAVDGRELAVRADSICIHGDAPGAERAATAIATALRAAGVVPEPFVR